MRQGDRLACRPAPSSAASSSSVPSSMIVRSAVKLVSNTRVEAQPAQGGDHLAGHQRAGRIAEALAQGGADGRRGLHDHVLGRVVERLPDLVDLVAAPVMAPTGQTAAHWPHCTQTTSPRFCAKAGPMTVSKPRFCGNRPPTSCVSPHTRHAAAALDALAGVADQGRACEASILLAGLLARVARSRGCPARAARACSSQSSLRSQVWQSPLCSESSSSTTVCAAVADAAACWCAPSCPRRRAGSRRRRGCVAPSTSTRQTRQAPMACTSSR